MSARGVARALGLRAGAGRRERQPARGTGSAGRLRGAGRRARVGAGAGAARLDQPPPQTIPSSTIRHTSSAPNHESLSLRARKPRPGERQSTTKAPTNPASPMHHAPRHTTAGTRQTQTQTQTQTERASLTGGTRPLASSLPSSPGPAPRAPPPAAASTRRRGGGRRRRRSARPPPRHCASRAAPPRARAKSPP